MLRFDPGKVLLDPYSKSVAGLETWGEVAVEKGRLERLRSRVVDEEFDWGHEHPLAVPLADSVIYELHVRGFTRHPSSGVSHPGTFRGLVEKIPYLQELGVTAVELMPVTEFDEGDNPRTNLLTGEPLRNFWGYQPVAFFAPKASYAAGGAPAERGARVQDDGQGAARGGDRGHPRRRLQPHRRGRRARGHLLLARARQPDLLHPRAEDGPLPATTRAAGTRSTATTRSCASRSSAALRYWVTEMHVDGFRFDLASILGRGRDGEVLPNPPLLEAIADDPVMADVKLIAEAWDAAGLYQVGSFPSWGRWAEWNGKFRDEVRRFVKSDPGTDARSSPRGSREAPTSTRARTAPRGTRSTS